MMNNLRMNLFGKEDYSMYAQTGFGFVMYIFFGFMFLSYASFQASNFDSLMKDQYKSFRLSNKAASFNL